MSKTISQQDAKILGNDQIKPNHVKSELGNKIEHEVSSTGEELSAMQIPEAQGDLADRANIEIDQEIQEKIWRIQQAAIRPVAENKNTQAKIKDN